MESGHRVLLVDDEPALLGALRRVVSRACPGAIVVYAADAKTAEWQLRSTTVRFVVTDLRMHCDDSAGLRVVNAAKEAGVPVAVITGRDGQVLADLEARDVPIVRKHLLDTARLEELVAAALAA